MSLSSRITYSRGLGLRGRRHDDMPLRLPWPLWLTWPLASALERSTRLRGSFISSIKIRVDSCFLWGGALCPTARTFVTMVAIPLLQTVLNICMKPLSPINTLLYYCYGEA